MIFLRVLEWDAAVFSVRPWKRRGNQAVASVPLNVFWVIPVNDTVLVVCLPLTFAEAHLEFREALVLVTVASTSKECCEGHSIQEA